MTNIITPPVDMDHQSSAATVFNLPELVDIIVDFLDQGRPGDGLDIFRAMRVNSMFYNRIQDSTALKKTIFMHSEPAAVIQNISSRNAATAAALRTIKLNQYFGIACPTHSSRTDIDSETGNVIYDRKLGKPGEWDSKHYAIVLNLPTDSDPASGLNASWRNMFVSSPPVTDVSLFMPSKITISESMPLIDYHMVVTNSNGVTLGEIVDAVKVHADTKYLQGAPFGVGIMAVATYERMYAMMYSALDEWHGAWRRK